MTINLMIDDTARALGLRYLMSQYFDIDAAITDRDPDTLEKSDTPDTIYITSAEICVKLADFFIPRRQRTIVAGGPEASLNLCQSESALVDSLRHVIDTHKPQPTGIDSTPLSQREIEVLRLVASGCINKEIADRLNISFNTVLTHRRNITTKLGIRSVSGLGVYALMNGIISQSDLSQ